MSVAAARVTVSSSAVALNTDTGAVSGGRLVVKNTDDTDALVLGDSSVTSSTGFALDAGLTVRGGSTDITAHVLRLGG